MSMIGSYTKDKIDILRDAKDKWGVSTRSFQLNINAHVEMENRVVRNIDGEEVTGEMTIFLDPSIDILYQDRIRVKELIGGAIQNPNKEYAIFALFKPHGFDIKTWEVVIGSRST